MYVPRTPVTPDFRTAAAKVAAHSVVCLFVFASFDTHARLDVRRKTCRGATGVGVVSGKSARGPAASSNSVVGAAEVFAEGASSKGVPRLHLVSKPHSSHRQKKRYNDDDDDTLSSGSSGNSSKASDAEIDAELNSWNDKDEEASQALVGEGKHKRRRRKKGAAAKGKKDDTNQEEDAAVAKKRKWLIWGGKSGS